MKMTMLLCFILFLVPVTVQGQTEIPPPVPPVVKVDSGVTTENPIKDVVTNIKDVVAKAKEVSKTSDKTEKLLIILGLLAALFKLLISLLKVLSKWFTSKVGGTVIRISTLVLGVGVFLVTNLALKMPWYDAVWLSLSGPGALVLHELTLLIPWLRNLQDKTA